MDLILTGKTFSGKEAEEWGMAAKVVDGGKDELLAAAVDTAGIIAGYSRLATMAAKEVVNKSQELPLKEGVEYERRLFHSLFGSKDQKIGESRSSWVTLTFQPDVAFADICVAGMSAFAEKRQPQWSNE